MTRRVPSRARKRCKTGLTKCEDEYAVSQQRQALSAKANTGKFLGLRAEKPVKPNSAKTSKRSEGFNSQARWEGHRFRQAKGSCQVLECLV